MRLLLDTSSFLWFVVGSYRLSGKATELIEDFDNELGRSGQVRDSLPPLSQGIACQSMS
jgi:hypothetical protein